jgi:hypothetical protein
MMTNKTHRTSTRQLLAKVALVGAAIAIPMTTTAVPAMAAPTPVPGVVQVDPPWGGDGDGGWGGDGGGGGDRGGGDRGGGDGGWGDGGWGDGGSFGGGSFGGGSFGSS